MEGFFVLLVILFIGVAIASGVSRRNQVPVWAAAARDLGIAAPTGTGAFSKLSMSGTVEGRHLSVRERSDDDSTWIEYELDGLRGMPGGLTIKAEHLGSRMPVVGMLFSGGQEQIATGDHRFDETFIVTGFDPVIVRTFLTDERRRALLRLSDRCPRFRLKDGRLTYHFPGGTGKVGNVALPAFAMIETARVLTDDGLSSLPPPVALAPRPAPSPPPAALFPAPGVAGAVPPPPAPPAPTSIDPGTAPPPRPPAPPAPPAAAAPPPSPPGIDGAVFPAPDPVDPPDIAQGAVADAPPAAAPEEAPAAVGEQSALLGAVFGVPSAAADAVFDEQLRGRRVRWSGEVRRAGRYTNDLDLGAGPGVRAVVDLGRIDTGTYGTATINAIVALPVETSLRTGDRVTFEGTMTALDHFARNLVVLDATVVSAPAPSD